MFEKWAKVGEKIYPCAAGVSVLLALMLAEPLRPHFGVPREWGEIEENLNSRVLF